METEVFERLKLERKIFAVNTALEKMTATSGLYAGKNKGYRDVKELLADAREIEKNLNEG